MRSHSETQRTSRGVLVFLIIGLVLSLSDLGAQISDTSPPILDSLSIVPTTVDVRSGDQIVTVTLGVMDDLAGVTGVWLSVLPAEGSTLGLCGFDGFVPRVAGDALNGTYEVEVIVPETCPAGDWLLGFEVSDGALNYLFLSPFDLAALGFPNTITVISDVVPDSTPPTLTFFSINQNSIDVSAGDVHVEVSIGVADAGLGTARAQALFWSPSRQQLSNCIASGAPLADGVHNCSVLIPQYSELGPWEVNIHLEDLAYNGASFYPVDLIAQGLPSELQVMSTPSDTTVPELLGLDFSSTFVDTSASSQSVHMTTLVSDDLSGMVGWRARTAVLLQSPSGIQLPAPYMPLTSGTPQLGTFEADVLFPQFSEAGTWRVSRVVLTDRVGNRVILPTEELEALGLPTQIIVVQPSLVIDGSVSNAGGTVIDDTFEDRAQLEVPAGVLPGPTDVSIDVFDMPLDIPNPTGFEAPGTHFVNVDLMPEPTYPLPAPGLIVTLPLVTLLPPGTVLNLFSVDPITGELVPSLGLDGMPVTGTVNLDRLSATFSGIAHFSVVVGLIPECAGPIEVSIDIKPGSFPNSINLGSKGTIPVAILSSSDFDAIEVNTLSVSLAGTGVLIKKNGTPQAAFEDVNADGLMDLVLHVRTAELQLSIGDTIARLEGMTLAGEAIQGFDIVHLVP